MQVAPGIVPAHLSSISTIQGPWFSLNMDALHKSFPRHELLTKEMISFLRDKKLQYIEIMVSGKRIAYYSKENFIQAIQYIKANYDEFASKSYAIRNNLYDYSAPDDLLNKNHTFTKPELIFRDQLSQVVYAIPLAFPTPTQHILAKLNLFKSRHGQETKNVLRFAPVGFAAIAIILGQVKQMDDPEHLTDSKSRTDTDFGTYYSYTLHHEDLPNGLKIIHLSDVHLDVEHTDNMQRLDKFADEMDSADFVFLTGDMFQSGSVDALTPEASKIFQKILNKADKGFFVLGNHDYRVPGESKDIVHMLDSIGYVNATNSYYELTMNGQKIGIAGLDDYRLGTPNSDTINIDTADNVFTIMLTHNLDGYHPIQDKHQFVDLVLSGHAHSGEIELGFANGTKTISGYEDNNKQLVGRKKFENTETESYISPGFSTINPAHVRLFANPAGPTSIEFKKIK